MEQHWRTLIWCIHNIGAHCLPHQGWAGIAFCSEMVILGSLLISAPRCWLFLQTKVLFIFFFNRGRMLLTLQLDDKASLLAVSLCWCLLTVPRWCSQPAWTSADRLAVSTAVQGPLWRLRWGSGKGNQKRKGLLFWNPPSTRWTWRIGTWVSYFFFVYTECVGVLKWCCCDSMAEVFFAPATLTITCSSHASGRHAAVLIQVSWRCALLCSCQGKVTTVKCFGKGWTQRLFCSRECWSLKETWCCGRRYWAKICIG